VIDSHRVTVSATSSERGGQLQVSIHSQARTTRIAWPSLFLCLRCSLPRQPGPLARDLFRPSSPSALRRRPRCALEAGSIGRRQRRGGVGRASDPRMVCKTGAAQLALVATRAPSPPLRPRERLAEREKRARAQPDAPLARALVRSPNGRHVRAAAAQGDQRARPARRRAVRAGQAEPRACGARAHARNGSVPHSGSVPSRDARARPRPQLGSSEGVVFWVLVWFLRGKEAGGACARGRCVRGGAGRDTPAPLARACWHAGERRRWRKGLEGRGPETLGRGTTRESGGLGWWAPGQLCLERQPRRGRRRGRRDERLEIKKEGARRSSASGGMLAPVGARRGVSRRRVMHTTINQSISQSIKGMMGWEESFEG
jgi:hypothetical protein